MSNVNHVLRLTILFTAKCVELKYLFWFSPLPLKKNGAVIGSGSTFCLHWPVPVIKRVCFLHAMGAQNLKWRIILRRSTTRNWRKKWIEVSIGSHLKEYWLFLRQRLVFSSMIQLNSYEIFLTTNEYKNNFTCYELGKIYPVT